MCLGLGLDLDGDGGCASKRIFMVPVGPVRGVMPSSHSEAGPFSTPKNQHPQNRPRACTPTPIACAHAQPPLRFAFAWPMLSRVTTTVSVC